jgi:hypothetical protein
MDREFLDLRFIAYIFFGDFFVFGKVPFKLGVKVFAQSKGPVVNVATLAFIYGTKNWARKVH